MENIMSGIMVAGIGIGVVFAFLAILVCAMFVVAKVMVYLNKLFPEAVPVSAPVRSAASDASRENEVVVAILSALLKNGSLK